MLPLYSPIFVPRKICFGEMHQSLVLQSTELHYGYVLWHERLAHFSETIAIMTKWFNLFWGDQRVCLHKVNTMSPCALLSYHLDIFLLVL